MTFDEFLRTIREHIGYYCSDKYWRCVYNHRFKKASMAFLLEEMPYLAVNAVATDYASRHG